MRLLRTCEWLTEYPETVPFPQISQRRPIGDSGSSGRAAEAAVKTPFILAR